jgi:hypothetical protein
LTVSSLRVPAEFISPRRRSWDSPFGVFPSRKVSERYRSQAPTCCFSRPYTRHECRAVLPGRSSWALPLPRVPREPSVRLTGRLAGYSLGFRPFQGSPARALTRISPDLLSRAFPEHSRGSYPGRAPECRWALAWSRPPLPASWRGWGETALIGFCTGAVLTIRAPAFPGYVFTSYRAAHHCRQTGNL